jgi:hypothetical protein
MNAATTALLTTLLFAAIAPAQGPNSAPVQPSAPTEEKEPAAIVELGAAGEWALTHGRPSYGPNLAVEFTPIPEWLEIEAGVTPMFDRLDQLEARYEDLGRQLSDPTLVNDQKKFQAIAKQHRDLEPTVEKFREYRKIKTASPTPRPCSPTPTPT